MAAHRQRPLRTRSVSNHTIDDSVPALLRYAAPLPLCPKGNDAGRSLMHLLDFNRWLCWRAEGFSYWTPSYWGFGVGTVSANVLQEEDVLVVTRDGAVWLGNLRGDR